MHVYYFKFIDLSSCVWVCFIDKIYGIKIKEQIQSIQSIQYRNSKFLYVSQKIDHMNPQITGADKGNFNNIIIAYKAIMNIVSWSPSVLGDH